MKDELRKALERVSGLAPITNDKLRLARKVVQRFYIVGENSPKKIIKEIIKEIENSRRNKALNKISVAKVRATDKLK